jgi:hypothetical protein
MELDLDKSITQLYANMLVQNAALKMLIGILVGYISTKNESESDIIEKFIKDNLLDMVYDELLSSQFSEEYLREVTDSLLQTIPGIDLTK